MLLVTIPSKGRPDKLARLVDDLLSTDTILRILVATPSPEDILDRTRLQVGWVLTDSAVVPAQNEMAALYPEANLLPLSDDVVITDPEKFSAAMDMLASYDWVDIGGPEEKPGAFMAVSQRIRTTPHFHNGYQHFFADTELYQEVHEACRGLSVGGVLRHHHPVHGYKADATFRHKRGKKHKQDEHLFKLRRREALHRRDTES